MSLAEELVKTQATPTPNRYSARVRWVALIYFALSSLSILIILTVIWRVQFFITLSQRSNVETLTLAIIFVLAIYYLITTFKGFVGALRILWLNAPRLWTRDDEGQTKIETRKHDAVKSSKKKMYVCFDQAIRQQGKPDAPIRWELADDVGRLGTMVVDGVKAIYEPEKDGMSNSIFEFLDDQIEKALKKQDPDANLQITQWSSIDADQASSYYNMVCAFQNLQGQLGNKGPVWPTLELTQEDVDGIGEEFRKLVPTLRNEAHLPKVEYEVEYNVPIIPEPLGFVRLTRRDNRADPLISMGCAGLVMLVVMLILALFILLPPWVPSS